MPGPPGCICICICLCMSMSMFMSMSMSVFMSMSMPMSMSMSMYVYIYICVCVYVHIYIYMCVCVCAFIFENAYLYLYNIYTQHLCVFGSGHVPVQNFERIEAAWKKTSFIILNPLNLLPCPTRNHFRKVLEYRYNIITSSGVPNVKHRSVAYTRTSNLAWWKMIWNQWFAR